METQAPILLRATGHDPGGDRSLQRRHRAGQLVRLAQGVYVESRRWERLDPVDQHVLLARAVAPSVRRSAAFSHVTAAIAYGWPFIGRPPDRVHVTDGATIRTEHRAHLVRHAGTPACGRATLGGVPITTVLQTALDLAATLEPAVAAVAIDHAVRTGALGVDVFAGALPPGPRRGSVRSRTVAAALDPGHESAGESYASIRMVELGLPRPVVQQEFRHRDGVVDRVDFWFPELGVVVEFDGKQKYSDTQMLAGRTPSDAVWQEKIREDRLRSLPDVRTVVRPTWWHLVDPERLRTLFRQHSVVI
ncbi:hypothetical protein ACTJKO_09365 [Curtobacterium sp. 22159]|uniref:hypothetical protein n=1 Tax=Curtobacterium sp. 22159 TaxID=3453882 RepID=UPI003F863610